MALEFGGGLICQEHNPCTDHPLAPLSVAHAPKTVPDVASTIPSAAAHDPKSSLQTAPWPTTQPVVQQRVRREIRSLSAAEREAFFESLWILKTLPTAEGRARYGPAFVNYDEVTRRTRSARCISFAPPFCRRCALQSNSSVPLAYRSSCSSTFEPRQTAMATRRTSGRRLPHITASSR